MHLKLCRLSTVMLKLFNLPGGLQIVPCIPDKQYTHTYYTYQHTNIPADTELAVDKTTHKGTQNFP